MRILIADGEPVRGKTLAEACLAQDHSVERVAHGAAALELALERVPEVVICPIDLPVIDGTRLAEILRSNPRTRGASFIFLVKDELDAPLAMDPRDATLGAPWSEDAVLEHIHAVLERNARFGDSRTDTEMEGKLTQISVLDLLQLFQMNRKSGTVRISREGTSSPASIAIRAGQVIDATIPLADGGSVLGEKGLYRLLTWKEGRFEFLPGAPSGVGRIRKPMRALLLEGMRQLDEGEKQRANLPSEDARLRLKIPRDRIPANIHPLTREVIDAIEQFHRVGDILDQCSFPDYQVLRVLADLLRKGGVELETQPAAAPSSGKAEEGLFTPTQVRRLREWAAERARHGGPVIKVLALGESDSLRSFYQALRECPDFRANTRLVRQPERVGTLAPLGHFHLGEGLSLRVIALPADPSYAALWDVAAYGMLGAIVLPNGVQGAALERSEQALRRLREASPRPLLHLVQADDASTQLGARAREQLGALEGGTAFVLPAAPSSERIPVLRNLFARLVP